MAKLIEEAIGILVKETREGGREMPAVLSEFTPRGAGSNRKQMRQRLRALTTLQLYRLEKVGHIEIELESGNKIELKLVNKAQLRSERGVNGAE